MKHTFEADSVQLEFGSKKILSDVYLKCETGQITGILGRNGEGKSCLMNIIYGSLKPQNKSIRFNNVFLSQVYKRPDLMTYLPQHNFIPQHLTVKRVFDDFEIDFKEFEVHFPELSSHSHFKIANLSGGQRRLIEVYMIIKSKSQFSMLDEPFSHLMPLHVEKMNELLHVEKEKKGFLITDHLFQHVVDLSHNLYVLKDGKTHFTKNQNDLAKLGYARP